MGKEEARATIKGRLGLGDLDRAKLLYTMRLFKEAVEKAHHLIKEELSRRKIVKTLYWTIPNAHYCESAYTKAKLYSELCHLSLKKPLLFSLGRGAGREGGNRNMRIEGERIRIKIPHANGKHEWIEGELRTHKKYKTVLEELKNYSYSAGVAINNGSYSVYVSLPVELYAKISDKKRVRSDAKHIAAFDLNSDRINMALLRANGLLIETRNHHFPEVNSPGYRKDKARDTRLKALSELIDYATTHGARVFVFEKLKMKGRKNISSKKGNRKLSKFAARELLSHAEIMVKKRGGEFKQVNAAYSSQSARIINQDLGVDVHTASAVVLGLRYLHTHKYT